MCCKNKYLFPKPATTAAFKEPKYHHGTVAVPSCFFYFAATTTFPNFTYFARHSFFIAIIINEG